MSIDFIIVADKREVVPEITSNADLVRSWFGSVLGVAPETLERLRAEVFSKLETGACRHLLPKMPAEHLAAAELQVCVEQVITEQWDTLTPEDRLLTRFPSVQAVGATVEIPKRGKGVVIRRELTRRFGIEMVFRLADGSMFKWEFID